MKNNKENSRRWLEQARFDLKQAEKLLSENVFSYACFFAEQSAQKSLKAFLIAEGKRFITIHSIGELIKVAAGLEREFETLIEEGKKLDRHYISARYPDALPEPAIPATSYIKSEAEEAVNIALKIFDKCESSIKL